MSMIDPIIAVYYVKTVGLNPFQLVLVGMISQGSAFIFQVPTGVVADLYSRKLSIIMGVFCVGLCFVIEGMLPFLIAIAVAEVIRGLGRTFIDGAMEAWIADEIGMARVGPAFIRYAQVQQASALIGTIAGVGLATIQLNVPILLGGSAMVVLAGMLILIMPEHGFTPEPRHERSPMGAAIHTMRAGARSISGRPLLVTFMAIWGIMGLATEGLDRLWEAHLLANFAFPELGNLDSVAWFGAINITFMLLSLAGSEVVRRKLDLQDHAAIERFMFALSAIRIVSVIWFGLSGDFGSAVIAYLIMEVCRRISQPVFTGWLNRQVDSRYRATVFSFGGQIDSIGQLAGGPLIGLIGTYASLRAAMVGAGLLLAPILPLLLRASRQGQLRAEQTSTTDEA